MLSFGYGIERERAGAVFETLKHSMIFICHHGNWLLVPSFYSFVACRIEIIGLYLHATGQSTFSVHLREELRLSLL